MRTVAGILDTQQPTEPENLYDRDFYTWARQQANALKQRNFTAIDWENITEEIEALVRAEESSLRSQYVRIIEHFLKLQYRKDRDGEPEAVAGWLNSISNAQIEIEELLQDCPG